MVKGAVFVTIGVVVGAEVAEEQAWAAKDGAAVVIFRTKREVEKKVELKKLLLLVHTP
jgi:hypothetical protein